MIGALRRISVERGHDPRDFVLVSFGGAGPLHACALARALRIPKVLVPSMPGALSAFGILVSDVIRDYSRTVMLKPGDESIGRHFQSLEELAARDMQSDGLSFVVLRSLDLRYAGQGYELNVSWSSDFVECFHRLHQQRYGYADPLRPVEIVNARVRAISNTDPIPLPRHNLKPGDGSHAVIENKPVYFEKHKFNAEIFDRALLDAGDRLAGPAVIVEYSATTFLPPDSFAQVDEHLNLMIQVDG